MKRRPPPCTAVNPAASPHALTYARLYPSGWWCDRHTPNIRAGRTEPYPPPGPGWPIHRQPPPDTPPTEAVTSTEHEEPTP
ncbi:hypothetical protein [Streptomyces antibioticus]|uniref:hypothetical protein n=1 Tax=Streptomyces antibioticus TaxID=1890 RepID=UPI0033BAB637